MDVEVICPECGGVIGATESRNGRDPCVCLLKDAPSSSADEDRSDTDVIGTAVEREASDSAGENGSAEQGALHASASRSSSRSSSRGSSSSAVSSDAPPKNCIMCGRDVRGHTRVKDSRGYLCKACAKAEREAEKAGKFRCDECGRYLRPDGLVQQGTSKICKRCFAHHKESDKIRVKKVTTAHFDLYEKQKLIIMAAVAAVLLVLMLISWLKH